LSLKLRAKSTTQSHRAPVYYVDLVLREGLSLGEALPKALEMAQLAERAGIDFVALEEGARQGLSNGAFKESEEEQPEVLAEFFPEVVSEAASEITESERVVVEEAELKVDPTTIMPSQPSESGKLEPVPTRRVR